MVSSLLSMISTLSKNQPALAWLLSCRILSFFRGPRSTAEILKTSSWFMHAYSGKLSHVSKCLSFWIQSSINTYLAFLKFVQVV